MATAQGTTIELEAYKLSEIFSIVPEYEGDQIFLGNFLNACDCAYDMATEQQRVFLIIHIKNKLRGRAAQLINSRNPASYSEIKQLLSLHFGDSRDLSSLIQDLQRLKQLSGESPLTFFNRLQVLNAKMHSYVQKSYLTRDQKMAQTDLIDTMSLNTLLTGLEPRLGQLIRASNPNSLVEAQNKIRRELQLSYLENQKTSKSNIPILKPIRTPSLPPKCSNCNRIGHLSNQCRQNINRSNFSQNSNPNFSRPHLPNNNNYNNNSNSNNNSSHFNNNNNSHSASKPNTFQQSQQRTFNGQNQNQSSRPTFQRNFNQPQQRAHHVNFDNNFNNNYSYEEYPNYDLNDNGNFQENDYYDEYSYDTPNPDNYSDFLDLTTKDQPPDTLIQDPTSEIQTQIQALNLEDMNPNLNFPEQKLL